MSERREELLELLQRLYRPELGGYLIPDQVVEDLLEEFKDELEQEAANV
jgi:hypothetical protein